MSTIFITATGTGVGKSYAAKKLIESFKKENIDISALKPIETGVKDTPSDAKLLAKSLGIYNPFDLTVYTFPLASAPFCADIKKEIDIEKIIKRVKELEKMSDIVIVEGAGGLMVPIKKEYFMIDLIEDLNAYTLLVTPSHLGCINETLLSIEALKSRKIDYEWCVNLYKDKEKFSETTKPFYDSYFTEWWTLQDGLEKFKNNILKRIEKSKNR